MRSLNGSIHTTQTPPPLSFYNTFKELSYEKVELNLCKSMLTALLKVHKREIFYGSDFEFFTIS
jgi:hypothetical protein